MLRYKNKGYVIEIDLPEECGHVGYSVQCMYQYVKENDKYLLSMWLKRKDIDDKFKIDSQEVDTQYISSTKENVKFDICKIIEETSLSGFFDYYIERFEHTYKCFDYGNDYYEKKALG